MTLEQINKAQNKANVKYETAKAVMALLEEAQRQYEAAGGDDWLAELDEIEAAEARTGRHTACVFQMRFASSTAHLRALSDAGVPIDVVGGTSQGALVGAAFARGASTRNMMRRCAAFGALAGSARQLLADATLPLLSFFAGWGLEGNIRAALGDTAIEDLWLRFFCCSTNLSRGTLAVHERGPAARYVRAAQTVLGLLPPVADAGGDLLVDGGYLNNVRFCHVFAMRLRCVCHRLTLSGSLLF
jgi:hypothetical protein